MFKLVSNRTFKRTVKISAPVDGGLKESTFGVTFKALPVSKLKEYALGDLDGQLAFLREVVVGIDDVQDESGTTLTFTDELREQLIDLPFVRVSLIASYDAGIMGAREKN